MKTKTILWCVAIALTLLGCVQQCSLKNLRKENLRLAGNQTSLLKKATYFENKWGESQASVQRLQLTTSELQRHNVHLTNEIRRLDLKLSRVNSITATATQNTTAFVAEFRDTILEKSHLQAPQETARYIEYSDPWNRFSGYEIDGIFTGEFVNIDTLIQVVHRIPKQWPQRRWLFRWGTKAIQQEVVSKNPSTRVVYNEYIELK